MSRALAQLVYADFLQRVRSRGFVMTLAPAVYLGYTIHAGYWSMRHGGFRAEHSAAYTAVMTALLAGVVLSWFGFYLVKNVIERDRSTGVGEILATTPLSAPTYTLGKALSNFLVLAAMVTILAGAAAWMGGLGHPASGFSAIDLMLTFALFSLPTLALTASAAVVFESVRWLRGGLGNVVWFFLFGMLLAGVLISGQVWADFSGFSIARASLVAAQQQAFPAEPVEIMSLSAGPSRAFRYFPWAGIVWSGSLMLSRVVWLLAATGLALLAALPFDRFDPSRHRRKPAARRGSRDEEEGVVESAQARSLESAVASTTLVRRDGEAAIGFRFWRLLRAELALLLKGQPWLWWAGVIGLLVAQVVAPLDIVRRHVLPLAWIWPLLVWSSMGCRDRLHRTEALTGCGPRPVLYQLPAAWAAGAALVAVTGSPALVRLLVAGETPVAIAAVAAVVFVPSLALACGAWSGSSRLFEVVYLVVWYAGVLNGVAQLDFIGATEEAIARGTPALFALAALPLVGAAAVARLRRP